MVTDNSAAPDFAKDRPYWMCWRNIRTLSWLNVRPNCSPLMFCLKARLQ